MNRRRLFHVLQVVFVGAVVFYTARALRGQWADVGNTLRSLTPRWDYIGESALIVLATYLLLIQTWRFMLRGWDQHLSFASASRTWFVSNLARYLPGGVWQIAVMGVMAKEQGVSPIAATGSSLIVNLVNVLAGFAVVFLTGAKALSVYADAGPRAAAIVAVLLLVGLIALPVALPLMARLASRMMGRPVALAGIPARVIWLSALGTTLAWLSYGIAFRLFALGILHHAGGATTAWIAVFTASYLVGYLALVIPGGLGVREAMLVASLASLGLLNRPEGLVLAVTSRLWLTVLEIVPGLLLLARPRARRTISSLTDDATV